MLAFADWKRAHPGTGHGRPAVLHGGRGVRLGAEPGQGVQLRRPDAWTSSPTGMTPSSTSASRAIPPVRWTGSSRGYSAALRDGALRGVAILNYVSSHDDGSPYDQERRDPLGAGTRLLLAPGGAQIYYGDELARPLVVPGAEGDANLRSFMNWDDLERGGATAGVLQSLADAGPIPPRPSGRGGRRASHASSEAVHLQPHTRDERADRPRSGGDGSGRRGEEPYPCSAYSPRALSWWTGTRA